MPGAGVQVKDWFNTKQPQTQQPAAPTTQYGNPNTFTTAANQQAKDYDTIMGMYGNAAKQNQQNPLTPSSVNFNPATFQSITPQTAQYRRSGELDESLKNLSELSKTGGYSAQGIADLRERGVSPVRSVYASAQRNVNRQKALSGGYSPNFNAVTAKMAREMSNEIANQLTNVNAGIAQNVATNRLSASGTYAGAAGRENEARTGVETHNADVTNDANKFNSSGAADMNRFNSSGALDANKFNASAAMDTQRFNRGNQLSAINGMTNLYGTTPALTSLFGQQVSNAHQMGQNQQQIDNQRLGNIFRGAQS